MEVDTGATLSVISEETHNSLWSKDVCPPLRPTLARLKTYTGEQIKVMGTISVDVCYNDQTYNLDLNIVKGSGPSLLGRDWMHTIPLDWSYLKLIRTTSAQKCQHVIDRYPSVFKDELGLIKDTSTQFKILPYALRPKVEAELDRLEKSNIISPVTFSKWAAPIVPVLKRDGKIRICGDYKLTVNQATKTDPYPLPRIEDIFASLSKGKSFTKLDLTHAYQQIPLSDEAKELTTINTHKGLYQYNRLPFGVSSAPAIFQRTMDSLLQGLPNVCVYLDDLLITGQSDEEHLKTLDTVLARLHEAGVRLKLEKCAFMLSVVEYLGHRISADGLHPTLEKVKAVRNAPTPTNVSQLKSFLGILAYYCKFLPNMSTVLAPLYKLLQKNVPWTWGTEQQIAFDSAKSALTSDRLLVHYDPDKELNLACDASPYGVGAVLSHRLPDGSDQPISFASRSLASAERKYSQLDKEALAIVFGNVFISTCLVDHSLFSLTTNHSNICLLKRKASLFLPQLVSKDGH